MMHTRFTDLRQVLSKRYSVPFPHYEPDVSSSSPAAKSKAKKSKSADKPVMRLPGQADPADDKSPASRLRIAKQLVKAKKFDGARKHLDAILKDHPDSEEAKEARSLRDEIEGKREDK
jgi:predicted Zn-dependent protease